MIYSRSMVKPIEEKKSGIVFSYFYVCALAYVLLPIPFDFLAKLELLTFPISAIIRVTILLLFITYKNQYLKKYSVLLVLTIFSSIFAILLAKNILINFGTPYLFLKMMVVVGMAVILTNVMNVKELILITKIFLVIYALNSIFIIIGAFFDIQIFNAGGPSYRFGYSGILPAAGNESAILLMIMFTAIYLNTYHFNYLEISKSNSYIILLCFLISMLLSGSKLATLYPFVLFISHRMTFRHSYIVLTSIASILYLLYVNLERILSIFDYFYNYYNDRGIISMLLASRNTRLANYDFDFNLIGFLIGNSSDMINFEMDILTVYYNLGVIGLIMLCIPFLWCVVPRIRSRISLAYSSSILVTIFFTGHIIESGFIVVPLIALSKIFFKYDRQSI